jgi:hypothetical protein
MTPPSFQTGLVIGNLTIGPTLNLRAPAMGLEGTFDPLKP